MISTYLLNFDNEFFFFTENFNLKQNYFNFKNYSSFLFLFYLIDYNFLNIIDNSFLYSKSLIKFIDVLNDSQYINNLENIKTIYHYSIPNVKLLYPEPFIASASLMHNDLWFIHILVYQYWLWFVFVFLIIFFFINFICILRWCNMRIRPRRETRGVSRSKCADLITACVPVSWATSIIVSESTDAIDYYDGFGTSELVVGIRAYQWGWEYYYPKDIDLNYNIKNNFSIFLGNSLKYNKTTDKNLKFNNLWKFYQNKNFDSIVTPANLIYMPIDNYNLLNFLNLNDLGSNPLNEVNAFKKIKTISKTNINNLINIPLNSNYKYNFLINKFNDESLYLNSLNYGFKKQHTFLNNLSINNNQQTNLNFNNVLKWLNFYINKNYNILNTFKNDLNINLFDKKFNYFLNLYYFKFKLLNNVNLNKEINNLFKSPNLFLSLNNDSDKKQYNYLIYKLINLNLNNNSINNYNNLSKINYFNEQSIFSWNKKNLFFNNDNKIYKKFTTFSSNQSILTNDKSLRNFNLLKFNNSNFNLSNYLNNINSYYNNINNNYNNNSFFFFNLNKSNWINLEMVNKLSSSIFYIESPYTPINSNYPINNLLNFDDVSNSFIKNVPTILQGKEDQMPGNLLNVYWNFFFFNTDINIRVNNNLNYFKLQNNFYLPLFSFYYDYDFRNLQSIELLEDSYWESAFSNYLIDEYLNITKEVNNNNLLNKNINNFFFFNKNYKINDKLLNYKYKNLNYSNYIYIDDLLSNTSLLSYYNFNNFFFLNFQVSLEDNYEFNKYLNYIYNFNNKILIQNYFNFFNTYSYSFIFDMFRSDYDEFSWFIDNFNFNNYYDNFNFNLSNSNESNFRFSNYLNLRSSVKNSITTYNAIQKIFRSRFDEGRSNIKLTDFGNFYSKQPYISSNRINYEKLLGKNKENFYKVNFYKNNFFFFFNNLYSIFNSLNYYFYDFPFLLAHKSDASRYLWFDWFARWGFYEVQPSSASKYAIFGMPYFNKNFEYNTQINDNLNETETYFIRLSKARKNYLPNWIYTPYYFYKNNNFYKNNFFFNNFNKYNSIYNTYYNLYKIKNIWSNINLIDFNSFNFNPSNSNIKTYSRGVWKPQSSVQSYYYSITTLIDILTKREYMYRQLLEFNNKIIFLPLNLTANPSNPIINDLKSIFYFIDPIVYNNEYSKDIYFNSLNFFNFNIWKSYINDLNTILNLSYLNFFFFYFFNLDKNSNFNLDLYKNQYRPMRKGITNMIRLHATGAIALPSEIRIQILASSKDVIHSWAIPSAGIKIDCVPGYSSHKIFIFLLSGIFWGQCMEICGRYHHWMPIVVYFMKRDLFFLWCTHFVFLSGSNNMWTINDKQFNDYIKLVSYDKNSWIMEFN